MKTSLLWIPLAALLLLAAPLTAGADDDAGKIMDLTFERTPVGQVIQRIAELAGKNVIVSPEVQGSVSITLRDVPWRKALAQVALTVGARVVAEAHGIVRVVPAGEAAGMNAPEVALAAELARARVRLVELETARAEADAEGRAHEVRRTSALLAKAREDLEELEQATKTIEGARLEGLRHLHEKVHGLHAPGAIGLGDVGEHLEGMDARVADIMSFYDVGDLGASKMDALEEALKKFLAEGGSWKRKDGALVVRAAKAQQEHVRSVLERLRQDAAEDAALRVRIKMDGIKASFNEQQKLKSDGKGGWVPVEAGTKHELFSHIGADQIRIVDPRDSVIAGKLVPVYKADSERARKRIEDMMAAIKHLQAAGLNDEAQRLHERVAQARQALAQAERQRAAAEQAVRDAKIRSGYRLRDGRSDGEQGVEDSIRALRQDVQALRGQVGELTDLVRKLLEQRDR